jgi:hypothetical protein
MPSIRADEQKIILDLCGGTGAWSEPYRDAGYDVRLVSLPEQDVIDYIPPKEVYGILAAPPCTMFSMARNRYNKTHPRDFISAMNPVNACIRIIWQCNPVFWALENPVGLLSRWLGKPQYTFHPWWFDEPWTKRTSLWGDFKIPKRRYWDYSENPKKSKVHIKGVKRFLRRKSGIPSIADITTGGDSVTRAITPTGFALAFFEANR